jgi:hypothetical protein
MNKDKEKQYNLTYLNKSKQHKKQIKIKYDNIQILV